MKFTAIYVFPVITALASKADVSHMTELIKTLDPCTFHLVDVPLGLDLPHGVVTSPKTLWTLSRVRTLISLPITQLSLGNSALVYGVSTYQVILNSSLEVYYSKGNHRIMLLTS